MRRQEEQRVKRHSAIVRLTHWINALALFLLLMSGLQIFNAHPALYWGETSTFDSPWLAIDAQDQPDGGATGYVAIAGHRMNTTGLLGLSITAGQAEARAFPSWSTLPAAADLAAGRRWHFLMAWLFTSNLAIYLVSAIVMGHLRRNIIPKRADLRPRALMRDIAEHARLRFPKGDAARSYNAIQKLTYFTVLVGILPIAIATGFTMSPALNAFAPWLVDLFGGRQSARSIHFIAANAIVIFVVVHIAMVLVSGAWNNMRSMVTGWYVLPAEERQS